MKCPKCHQVFSNELSFCLNDGSRLVADANLAGIDNKMSAETVLINHSALPIQKKSRWLLFSIGIAAVLIFMTGGIILGLQTFNNLKQEKGKDYDLNTGYVKPEKGSFDTPISDEMLDLNDSKTIDKLKNDGLIIAKKNANEIVKPNPLMLVVKINSQNGDLKLNNENAGNVLGKSSLGEKLAQIFKAREENKVYVENSATNENNSKVVKEVILNSNSQIKANYFYKTLEILKKSGATPIYLNVENSEVNTAENKTSGCQLNESVNIQAQKITFSATSYAITPETKTILESLAEDFKQISSDCQIEIGVHTDNVGDATNNSHLSFARALAIKEFLVKLGVDGNKLSVMGYGGSQPKYPNDTDEGKKGNRRTEFRAIAKN